MFPLFKQNLNADDKLFIVENNAISEWKVAEVLSAGHSTLYKLKKGDTDSFCIYEQSRIGKDAFTTKEDALKEIERQSYDKKIFKKI